MLVARQVVALIALPLVGFSTSSGGEGALADASRLASSAVRAAMLPDAARSPFRVSGHVVLEANGRRFTIPVGEGGPVPESPRRRVLRGSAVVRGVRPLWERADGAAISRDPAYRGREFTGSGLLVGKATEVSLTMEVAVELPAGVDGVRVRVELDDLTVTAHTYGPGSGGGRVVAESPAELGHLPSQIISASTGAASGGTAHGEIEATYLKRPGSEDVVRLTGFAFGMRCHYKILAEYLPARPPVPAGAFPL